MKTVYRIDVGDRAPGFGPRWNRDGGMAPETSGILGAVLPPG